MRTTDTASLEALNKAYTLANDQVTDPAPSVNSEASGSGGRELGATAGIVRVPGVDDALEAIESEEDIVKANRELLEGRPLTETERDAWGKLFLDIMREANKRLKAKKIVLLAAVPEPNGLGGIMTGCDAESIEAAERGISMPSEDYTVCISLPARERVDIAATSREEFGRWMIDLVCAECIEQQRAYRAKREFFN